MQELHVLIELYAPVLLDCVFDVQCITWLEQDRRVIHKLSIEDRVDSNNVLVNLRLDLVRYVVVDRISHIFGEDVFESLLVEFIIVKDLHHNV